MAEGIESNWDRFRSEGHQAFVLGYTGGIGQGIAKELAESNLFKRVVLIGRRIIPLGSEFGPEFEQKVVDFEKLEDYADVFEGLDTGFCALGTTQSKSGNRGFVRVDHDYVLNAAEMAKAKGCKHFNIITSIHSNKNSSILYFKTKGQVEDALKVMHFERLTIFRPGGVKIEREEPRLSETMAWFFLKPVTYLFPTSISVPLDVLSRAVVNNTVVSTDLKNEIFENKEIHYLGGASRS